MTVRLDFFVDQRSYEMYNSSDYHIISQSEILPPKASMSIFCVFGVRNCAIVKDKDVSNWYERRGHTIKCYCERIEREDIVRYWEDPSVQFNELTAFGLGMILSQRNFKFI